MLFFAQFLLLRNLMRMMNHFFTVYLKCLTLRTGVSGPFIILLKNNKSFPEVEFHFDKVKKIKRFKGMKKKVNWCEIIGISI